MQMMFQCCNIKINDPTDHLKLKKKMKSQKLHELNIMPKTSTL